MPGRIQVGTLHEKPLHAALKVWYSVDGDRIEAPVDGFVIDIVRGDTLIEIQTRSFSSMKRKLARLLEAGHRVRLVHPIATEKWIVKLDETGTVVSRRKSPKRGTEADVFAELVSLSDLITHTGLSLEVLMTREDEVRRFEAGRAWRRKGWVIEERRLIEVVDRIVFDSSAALDVLLPPGLPEEFTTADLARDLDAGRRLAQQMTYCLRHAGIIEMVGKHGNAIVYRQAVAGSGATPAGTKG